MFVEHSASEIAKVNRTIISDYVYLNFNHFELCPLFTFDLDIKGRVFILNCCKQALQYFILHLCSREGQNWTKILWVKNWLQIYGSKIDCYSMRLFYAKWYLQKHYLSWTCFHWVILGRLAIGVGDSMIRLWNMNNSVNPFDVTVLWQGIKSKVTAVSQYTSWHIN